MMRIGRCDMKQLLSVLLIAIVIMLILPSVSAAGTNITASRGVTANGPYNLLVPLGIEQVVTPLSTALMYYNWIAVMMIFFVMAMASQRNMRFFVIIIPLLAALLAFFGWLNDPSPLKVWSLIILTGFMAAAIYMKDTNKEKWGSGGPGLTLFNIVFFIILLQTAIGVVNSTAIWDHNLAVTPSQYQNVDLGTQMTGISNTGGLLDGVITTAVSLLIMGIMLLQTVILILLSVVCIAAVLLMAFPFLAGNAMVLAFIGAIQVIIWLVYAWFLFSIVYKPMPDGGYI